MKAYFELSKSKALNKYNELVNMGLRVSYSFKTNPEVGLLLNKETNCEFAMHSVNTIKPISNKSRVWFFPQGWNDNEVRELINSGVTKFVIDNYNDYKTLINNAKTNDELSILIRIRMKEHTIHTGKYFVYGFKTSKANELIRELSNKKWIKELGIHFHRKTENVSEWNIKEELNESITEWDKIRIVNIGGGLPIKYANIKDFNINTIKNKIIELRDWLKDKGIQLMIEPGRYISGPAVKLIAEVINVVDNTAFINCSVYNTSPDTLIYSIKLPIEGEGEGEEYLIKGNTACSLDIFRYKVKLPKLKRGDKIVFLNAGAYNFQTNFMWLEKPETIIVK